MLTLYQFLYVFNLSPAQLQTPLPRLPPQREKKMMLFYIDIINNYDNKKDSGDSVLVVLVD